MTLLPDDSDFCIEIHSDDDDATLEDSFDRDASLENSAVYERLLPLSTSSVMPRLGVITDHMWTNGRTITVCFLDGSATVQDKVKTYASQWMEFANITFNFIAGKSADIRITFTGPRGGSSSLLGSWALKVKDLPTMKLAFDDHTADLKIQRTTLHEFGHALGCVHEHQQPNFNFDWNVQAVIDYHKGIPGWGEKEIRSNIFRKYNRDQVQASAFDPLSIMLYPIPGRWTNNTFSSSLNATLSEADKAWISSMYPKPSSPSIPIIWGNGRPLVVTTRGVGNLHLLTYNNNQGGINTTCIAAVPTTNTGVTRFLVSFSHSYTGYAFFWDGSGEAVYEIGTDSQGQSVGRSWTQASAITFGATHITTADVSQRIVGATNTGQTTTCFIIPDKT